RYLRRTANTISPTHRYPEFNTFKTNPQRPIPTLFPYTSLFRSSNSTLTWKLVSLPSGLRATTVAVFDAPSWRPVIEIDSLPSRPDRKSTRLNSSHVKSSYAVFCLKKKTKRTTAYRNKTPTNKKH